MKIIFLCRGVLYMCKSRGYYSFFIHFLLSLPHVHRKANTSCKLTHRNRHRFYSSEDNYTVNCFKIVTMSTFPEKQYQNGLLCEMYSFLCVYKSS